MDCMLHMRFFYKVVIECRIFFACRGAFTALFRETASASMFCGGSSEILTLCGVSFPLLL